MRIQEDSVILWTRISNFLYEVDVTEANESIMYKIPPGHCTFNDMHMATNCMCVNKILLIVECTAFALTAKEPLVADLIFK